MKLFGVEDFFYRSKARELVSTKDTLAREQVSMQGMLAREHVSMQSTLAHEHVFSTQDTQFSSSCF